MLRLRHHMSKIGFSIPSPTHPQKLFFTQDVVTFLCGSSIVESLLWRSKFWPLWVSDSCTHHITIHLYIPPSSQHKFPTNKVTNFHEVPWLLSFVISCTYCHFLSSAVISFCCCLLSFPILPLSHSLALCLIVSTSINSVHIYLVLVFSLSFLDQGLD